MEKTTRKIDLKLAKIKCNNYLAKIKNNAIKLRARYSLPGKLTYYILGLTCESPEIWVSYLIKETEFCMRVSGFYKKYHEEEVHMDSKHTAKYAEFRKLGYFNEKF